MEPDTPLSMVDSSELDSSEDDKIRIEASEESTGLGLKNVQERLRIYYPDSHEFVTNEEAGWVSSVSAGARPA